MHVQIFLSVPFGTGKLMSGTPYRKISLKQLMLETLRGVCIRCSLRILYRTRIFMFFVLSSCSWMSYIGHIVYIYFSHIIDLN